MGRERPDVARVESQAVCPCLVCLLHFHQTSLKWADLAPHWERTKEGKSACQVAPYQRRRSVWWFVQHTRGQPTMNKVINYTHFFWSHKNIVVWSVLHCERMKGKSAFQGATYKNTDRIKCAPWSVWLLCTELGNKACMWFGEICSCSCLTVLPGPAWVLLSKFHKPFTSFTASLYRVTEQLGQNLPLTLMWKLRFSIKTLYQNATFK